VLKYRRKFLLSIVKNRLADPSEVCALEFKEEFRRSAICSVSATIGINRFDSAHPTDYVAVGSPAEKTVSLTIALEADREWPSTSPLGGPFIAALRGAQRNEMVDSYRLRTMWVACSVA
jgi:hypothetical protein